MTKTENKTVKYDEKEFENIDTGRDNQWKYSPRFRYPMAETLIPLTGSRKKDYVLAENITGQKREPKVTVWHHVWYSDLNGNYMIQLVDYRKHIETYPHAGGCKKWLLDNNKGSYNKMRRNVKPVRRKLELSDYAKDQYKQIVGEKRRHYSKLKYVHENLKNDYSDLILDVIFEKNDDIRYIRNHFHKNMGASYKTSTEKRKKFSVVRPAKGN